MKACFASHALLLIGAVAAVAQTPPALEDQLTTLWKQKNYTELRTLLDAKTSATPADVVALYCSKFFYVLIQPDKAKALSAAVKLKQAAEATANAEFVAFANGELAEVRAIPEVEFAQPSAEVLAGLHTEFADSYPNVEMGSRLRRFKTP